MTCPPRLTIGLPVYNGENFLSQAIEALLGQSFDDFELVISDNASLDTTANICKQYQAQDARIRYFRQPRNIGLSPNHNFTVDVARGEFFKWAAHDDLYARDLLKLCVEALDEYPDVVLANSWTARIDGHGEVVKVERYPLKTALRSPSERFRSTLFDNGGDDDGGVIRTEVLRRIAPQGSYHHADRTAVSELVLHGPFYHVPQWLFFRRDHPERAEWKYTDVRAWCANLDPRRADALRNPKIRLYAEYVWAYIAAIHNAPLTSAERLSCYQHLTNWFISRTLPGGWVAEPPTGVDVDIDIADLVVGQEKQK